MKILRTLAHYANPCKKLLMALFENKSCPINHILHDVWLGPIIKKPPFANFPTNIFFFIINHAGHQKLFKKYLECNNTR